MLEMHIRNDEHVCRPWGDLDWRTSVTLRQVVHDALSPGAVVVIDLGRVRYIDAVGLSAMLSSLRQARSLGARVRLCNIDPQVRWRMELVGVVSPAHWAPTSAA
jgi:anti-anti-sigma factor